MSHSTNRDLLSQIQQLRHQVAHASRPRSGAEIAEMEHARVRADSVLANFADSSDAPALGETVDEYRKRLLRQAARHTEAFRDADFSRVDPTLLDVLEDRIFADATAAAQARADASVGTLIPFEQRDGVGRVITKFRGDIAAFLAPFVADGAHCRITNGSK